MNFHTWLEHKTPGKIYLDFDDTLICHLWHDSIPRPHLHEFIKALKKIGTVEILTHGLTEYQTGVAKSMGIDLPVIGRDNYHLVNPSPDHILIDDTPLGHWRTNAKMEALGISPERFIQVRKCTDSSDDELMPLVNHVRKLVNTNEMVTEWVEKNPQVLPKKQPFKTYEKAKTLAKERRDKFYDGMKEAAEGHKVVTDIKSKTSFKDKTVARGKEPDKVYDVLRGAILVDNKDQIDDVLDRLKKVFLIKKVEHKVKPEFFGYYGATHVDVVIHDMICEIQIMTKKLWKYKMVADEIYQKYRSIDDPPKEEIEKSRKLFKIANES